MNKFLTWIKFENVDSPPYRPSRRRPAYDAFGTGTRGKYAKKKKIIPNAKFYQDKPILILNQYGRKYLTSLK